MMKNKIKSLWRKFIQFFRFVLKDRASRIIFIITFLVLSSPIWLFYTLGIMFKNGWLIGVASAYWLFWIGPFTPFIPLCLGITAGIRAIVAEIRKKINEKKKNKCDDTRD